jgi:hypothetical protein
MPERLPLQQFHGDERSPIDLVNLVDRADVRVIQGGSSFGFPLETAERLRIAREVVGKELQRDMPTELEVFCLRCVGLYSRSNFCQPKIQNLFTCSGDI